MLMEDLNFKSKLRKDLLYIRGQISKNRREISKRKILDLFPVFEGHNLIASFASFSSEIDVWKLNTHLMREERLLLPKVEDDELSFYKIDSLAQLIPSKWKILEPDPLQAKKVSCEDISIVLVPGLAFDTKNNRIGYGRGFYDRFLNKLSCKKIGIAFYEQYLSRIPTSCHDVVMDELYLF